MDIAILNIMMRKEALLCELIAWLKAKGLYEQAMKDCPSGVGTKP